MDLIYLDNNATTQVTEQVLDAMLPYFSQWYGNPSSMHLFGQRSRRAVDQARQQVASLIGCGDKEIVFTGGGTEAINTAITGILASRHPLRKVVTSAVEHSATRELCRKLAMDGVPVVEVGVDNGGGLDLAALAQAIDDQTALATIMWANNETGVVFPVQAIAELCRSRKVPFHCDGTQAVGKLPVAVREIGVDLMSMAAHKFHGPKGVGALYIRRGIRPAPLIVGGPQEMGRRGGTENVPAIVGMGKAAELATACLPLMPIVAEQRDRLEQTILSTIPDTAVNGASQPRLPNTANISFARLQAEAILILLSERGLCASAGAACSSGSLEPSHVLKAMGVDYRLAHGAVRFSLSRYTTPQQIDAALAVIAPAIARLRQVLPV